MQEKIALSRRFHIRLEEGALEIIKQKAATVDLSVSAYFRACALGKPIISAHEKQVRGELVAIAADLGRLGGLLKHWLTWDGPDIGEGVKRPDIVALFRDLQQTQAEFQDCIRGGGAVNEGGPDGRSR